MSDRTSHGRTHAGPWSRGRAQRRRTDHERFGGHCRAVRSVVVANPHNLLVGEELEHAVRAEDERERRGARHSVQGSPRPMRHATPRPSPGGEGRGLGFTLLLPMASLLAPASTSTFTISVWPLLAASCRGVKPYCDTALRVRARVRQGAQSEIERRTRRAGPDAPTAPRESAGGHFALNSSRPSRGRLPDASGRRLGSLRPSRRPPLVGIQRGAVAQRIDPALRDEFETLLVKAKVRRGYFDPMESWAAALALAGPGSVLRDANGPEARVHLPQYGCQSCS